MGFGKGKRYVLHNETRVYDAFEYHVLEISDTRPLAVLTGQNQPSA